MNIDFSILHTFTDRELEDLGCQVWDRDGSKTLWLYPREWYDDIPEDFTIVFIDNKVSHFKKGVTNNDSRFGALAFGFVKYDEAI